MMALITNVKSPRVRIRSGNVSSFSKGLTLAFSTPNTSATRNSETHVPSYEMPVTNRADTQSAAALISNRTRNGTTDYYSKSAPEVFSRLGTPARIRDQGSARSPLRVGDRLDRRQRPCCGHASGRRASRVGITRPGRQPAVLSHPRHVRLHVSSGSRRRNGHALVSERSADTAP